MFLINRSLERKYLKLYERLCVLAKACLDRNDINKSIKTIRAASSIAGSLNFTYTNNSLEELIDSIGVNVLGKENSLLPSNLIANRVVFYDGFGFSNVPLTLQYIRALIELKYDILYIHEDIGKTKDGELKRVIDTYSGIVSFELSKETNSIDKIKIAYQQIKKFAPSKALLQIAENNVECCVVFSKLPQILKFRINLGDHQFWLGARLTDYCMEFRDYGATISVEKRGFASKKLLYQPYYPYIDVREFMGFPFEKKSTDVLIFSGGRPYKVFGRNYEFFEIVKSILDSNVNIIFLFAGKNGGDDGYIRNFIKVNGFQKRFYYLGHRTDINEVFKNIDIFLNTYPISGGLMCMYAAVNQIPIITYTTDDLPENITENCLFNYGESFNITYHSKIELMNRVASLVSSKELRTIVGRELKDHVVSPNQFVKILKENLETPIPFSYNKIDIDYDAIISLNIDIENKYLNLCAEALLVNFRLMAFFYFPSWSGKLFRWLFVHKRKSVITSLKFWK